MTDDLTARVEERLFDMLNNPDIPEDDAGELAHELAPRIAAALEATARSMWLHQDSGQHEAWAIARHSGLAVLRGTEEPHE